MQATFQRIIPNFYRYVFLRPLGLNRHNSMAFWLLLLYGALLLGGLWFFEGNIAVVVVLLSLVSIILLTFFRPDCSFYLMIFFVLLFDQYGIPGFAPVTRDIRFFNNIKEISYLPYLNAGVMNYVELWLTLIILSVLIRTVAMRDFTLQPIPVWGPFLAFFSCYFFSIGYGLSGGGDFLVALWEVRALVYFFVLYLLVPQVIRNRQQLRNVIWICIFGVSVKAFQGIARFIDLGFTTGGFETLTNHEDPVFTVTLLILLLGFLVFNVRHKQRLWLLILLPFLLFGFYVALRRAAYASFMVSFATFMVLLPAVIRWKFLKAGLPFFIGIAVYVAVFWNAAYEDSAIAMPVQMVKGGFERPSIEENPKDYYSNLYREQENYNLAQTVVNHPITGTGFGKKYDQPVPLVGIPFPLRDYIPHNEIFWVIVKMGSIGFFAFWFFFNLFVAKGTKVFSRLNDPYLKAVALFIIVAVINQMVVSYFDLQLTYYRNMIYLGCVMGLLPVVEKLDLQTADAENQNQEGEQ